MLLQKKNSYEAVSSSKFGTNDVQIDIFSNFWLNVTGSSTKNDLQIIH